MQAQLKPAGVPHLVKVNLSIQLPQNAAGRGQLFLGGSRFGFGPRRANSFAGLVSGFQNAPHNYDVVGSLVLAHRTPSGTHPIHRQVVRSLNRVVIGGRRVAVTVVP